MADSTPTSRRRRVIDLLATSDGPLSAEVLREQLSVSLVTVRRDLETLERSGAVIRTHGGAMINSLRAERSISERNDTNALAKAEIAATAASLVSPGLTVFLDAGTTTSRIAAELVTVPDLTIVTSGLNVASVLAEAGPGTTVISTGGTLRRVNQAFLGPFAELVVSSIYADIAFIGTDCVHTSRGLSSRTPEQNSLKRLMISQARRPVVVADSSKLGATWATHWFVPSGPLELITDSRADRATLEDFAQSASWKLVAHENAGAATLVDQTKIERLA